MAFKNEENISEQDRAYFDKFHFVNPIGKEAIYLSKWTIDRENNMFLIALGGQGSFRIQIPMFYAFVIENQIIVMETYSRSKDSNFTEKGSDTWLSITKLSIPESIATPLRELVGYIKAAFIEECTRENTVGIQRLHFENIAEPRYVPVGYNLDVQS